MKDIWFKSRQKRNLTKHIEKILRKWQIALKEYQTKTDDLGYGGTEKSNFGFFLWGCVRLNMPFLLEFTTQRRFRGEDAGQGRPDCWILIDDNTDALIEVKRIYDRVDTPPRKSILRKIGLLKKELKSVRGVDDPAELIGLCFVILERDKEKVNQKSNRKALSDYLEHLKNYPSIDFFGAYLSPEEVVNNAENRYDDRWIYPAVVVIGKYF